MRDDVPPAEKKRRLHAVERLQEGLVSAINARLRGQTVEVLVEELSTDGPRKESAGPRWRGRTRTNKLVFFSDPAHNWRGKLARVRIDHTSPWSLIGSVVDAAGAALQAPLVAAAAPRQ
jgi:tRNA-2-methylthio-N6-dimethylallyladenosine synthase